MSINEYILKLASIKYYNAYKDTFKDENIDGNKKLGMLINHAIKNVPYYKEMFPDSLPIITDFPFLDKQTIINNRTKLCAANLPSSRFRANTTSGSSGKSLYFYTDNETDVKRHSLALLGQSWAGCKLGDFKLTIWGAERDIPNQFNLKKTLLNSPLLFNSKVISAFDLSNKKCAKIGSFINAKKPCLLIGYPSALALLSEFFIKNNVKLFNNINVITSGELLLPQQRNVIEAAFGGTLFNRYGSRDIGPIAHECKIHDGMHIFQEHVYLEVVDCNGNRCREGEVGEIIVTDLDNYVFPFIRYKIGDYGVLSSSVCPCGSKRPILKEINGRAFDIIVGPNGKRVLATYFSINFKKKINGIEQFQVIQHSLRDIDVKVKITCDFDSFQENSLISMMKNKLGDGLNVNVIYVDDFELPLNGKHRWVISKINNDRI